MIPGNLFLVLFGLCFGARKIEGSLCPEEESKVDSIQGNVVVPKWPQSPSSMAVYSDPLCLSEGMQVITRECAEKWRPRKSPECAYTSPRFEEKYCPPGYHVVMLKNENNANDYVCVGLSKSMWSSTCRFSIEGRKIDKEIFSAIANHLKRRRVRVVWLPVMRLDVFGPLLWQTPGENWGSRIKIPDGIEITYGNRTRRCLILDVSSGITIKPESCEVEHPFLCLVEKNYFPRGACPPKYVASPIPGDDRCFRLMKNSRDITWKNAIQQCTTAQINSPIVSRLFAGLARKREIDRDDFCWIGGDGRYRSNTMAINSKGQISNLNSNVSLHCIFCEMGTPSYPSAQFSLRFYPDEEQLLLTVYGKDGLWTESYTDPGVRCFTNANGDFVRTVELQEEWEMRWTAKDIEPDIDFEDRVTLNFETHKTIYSVDLSDQGPGYYVCEGHSLSNELITTKHVIAYKELDGYMFALSLEIMDACDNVESCDPTFPKMYKKLAKDVKDATPDVLVKDIRAMEVLDVTADGNVTVLFHVTIKELDDKESSKFSLSDAYKITESVFRLLASMYPNVYRFKYLRSCDGCPASRTGSGTQEMIWPFTYVGSSAVSQKMCLDSSGVPIYRSCIGNYIRGGSWAEPSGSCTSGASERTRRLYEISGTVIGKTVPMDPDIAHEILEIVESANQLTPADVYYLALITEHEAKYDNSEVILEDIYRFTSILDKVMGMDKEVIEKSQVLNSTNVLLDSLGTMLDTAATNISADILLREDGLILIETSHLIVQISDPTVSNVTGLALLRKTENSSNEDHKNFMSYTVVPLYADNVIEGIGLLGDVEVATWLPRSLLNASTVTASASNFTQNNSTAFNASRVIVTLFYSDLVFNSAYTADTNFVDSRVVSVSIPGYGRNLPIPIPLLFKPLTGTVRNSETCAFWDFEYVGVSPVSSYSAWSEEGCQNAGRTRDASGELNICLCSHLTHFAQLVLGHNTVAQSKAGTISIQHEEALEVITVIGCVLSMIGVFGILITAFIFKSWRKKPGTKVLIQLSLALGLEKFVIGAIPLVDSVNYPIPCIVVGILLHYAILAEFSWMLVTAWLQFKRYVIVLGVTRPPRFLLKAAAFAWGLPFLIVSIVVAIDPEAYLPPAGVNIRICQVFGMAQYIGLLLPVCIVILLNVILFLRVMHSLLRTTRCNPSIENDTTLVYAQFRLGIMLFFLLGITWLFGVFAKMGAGLIFSYLFCITAALQGFVLFLFFIVCDPATRKLWYSVIGIRGRFSSKGSQIFSASSGTSDTSNNRY
ncbi:uncharacterized protein LOC112494413 [Cephus cinctus]|uniref:Uncharacterized protein LOC112494413 n=1 Tax=Cephus cinctus TaxID=211228 RepID=A0AAJ7RIT6_CEPCN|nr:uncharacterized protein LOC112494413 [Cephus cinctus]